MTVAKEVEAWDGTTFYPQGSEVTHKGQTYRAKSWVNNPLIEPYGTDHSLWERLPKDETPVTKPEVKS